MPEFDYIAHAESGNTLAGTINAASRHDALRTLVGRSMVPVQLKPIVKSTSRKSISGHNLAKMYAHLADLLNAGVPLLRAIDILATRDAQSPLSAILADVRERVADGETLSAAMAEHPNVFRQFALSIVHAGEEGGFLEDSLERLAAFTERQEDLKARILGAIAYPLFLVAVGSVLLVAMLVFFVPKFMPIFDRLEVRGELPLPTAVLLGTSNLIAEHGVLVVAVLLLLALAIWKWATSESGRWKIDKWALKIYGIGPIVRSFAIANFCRVLGTLLNNGVSILRSLEISKNVVGNRIISDAVSQAAGNVTAGRSLAGPLGQSGEFPNEIVEMVEVGERTNRLERILIDAADGIDRRTNRSLDLIVRLIEPLLLLVMAVVILFLLLALLLPVLQSAGSLT